MSARVDRDLVRRLLEDDHLSYREIARRAQCSDFSVRAIARFFEADVTAEAATKPLTLRDWWVLGGVLVCIVGGTWLLGRRYPRFDGLM